MQLLNNNITQIVDEHFLLETFHLDGKTILELGCGSAVMTKKIANTGENRTIYATEVDSIQHKKNLQLELNNTTFLYAGAQEIPLEDESIDIVLMFKSFHHIPKALMQKALSEIKRVLKPNGLAYISEPLFQGEQNHLISLFHDEQQVRKDAFEAIKNFVEQEEMVLFQEIFFNSEVTYKNFEDFKTRQMDVTYNEPINNIELIEKVQTTYNNYAKEDGSTYFLKPFRVDILQKR